MSALMKKVSLEYTPSSDSPEEGSPPLKRPKPLTSTPTTSAFFKERPGESKIWGTSSVAQKVGALEPKNYLKHIEPFRVSLRTLSKKQQYQVLYVEEGAPLTETEKGVRKVVASSRVTS